MPENREPPEEPYRTVPVRSTVHVSLLPYSYTNNDIYKLFERFGRIARVTIMRNKETRESKGVAFVQFICPRDALKAIDTMDNFLVEGFHMRVSMSGDNGRSQEFIKKRKYTNKKICFECGEMGHYSYSCPRNQLGSREPPARREKRRRPAFSEERDSSQDGRSASPEPSGREEYLDDDSAVMDTSGGDRPKRCAEDDSFTYFEDDSKE